MISRHQKSHNARGFHWADGRQLVASRLDGQERARPDMERHLLEGESARLHVLDLRADRELYRATAFLRRSGERVAVLRVGRS